jgi:hypothetical protein
MMSCTSVQPRLIEVADTHSIRSIGNQDLGVFPVTKLVMKIIKAVTSAHLINGTPNAADQRL